MASPKLLDLIQSVVAALFGVQTEAKRTQDFGHHSPVPYLIVGVVALIVFVLGLWLLVQLALSLNP
ncbi:DUF2970 domain-containing protein [Ferrimonas marina]|uniref:DUF2970 domain-containing protein n=1 Tax=Ferrimonas marina TaxID=299255 RepID=A0A1M5XGK5_9GAMM|nr:DUF2970 domain-containing protein [Ferrimonas marina]SHH98916.1 Protein of unknown function [Ferrimonas marina]